MSSEATKIPFIDFSKSELKPGSSDWNYIKYQVMEALIEYGCFEALFSKDDEELGRTFIDALPKVFDLPLETKAGSFFVNYSQNQHLYESFIVDEAPKKVESLSNLIWPQGNPSFCNNMQSYIEKLREVDQMVHKIILESFGVEQYMDELRENSQCHIRFNKYGKHQNKESELGLVAHTDQGLISILHQNQINGLEVETKDGRWINVKPAAGSFIILVGDCFHAWTNGRLHHPVHRVMLNSGNETRYTAALASIPKGDYLVKAPEELIDEEHPLLFKPFDYVEYIAYMFSPSTPILKGGSALKSYCGM